jgi:hypothetical protein
MNFRLKNRTNASQTNIRFALLSPNDNAQCQIQIQNKNIHIKKMI